MSEKERLNSFFEIKLAISARAAGEKYGLHPNRNGMVRCPFHPDKTPSLKLDDRFHCFGCGADGDAIDLTAGLFGISLKDAAAKLSADFGLAQEIETPKEKHIDERQGCKNTKAIEEIRWM